MALEKAQAKNGGLGNNGGDPLGQAALRYPTVDEVNSPWDLVNIRAKGERAGGLTISICGSSTNTCASDSPENGAGGMTARMRLLHAEVEAEPVLAALKNLGGAGKESFLADPFVEYLNREVAPRSWTEFPVF